MIETSYLWDVEVVDLSNDNTPILYRTYMTLISSYIRGKKKKLPFDNWWSMSLRDTRQLDRLQEFEKSDMTLHRTEFQL